MGSPSKPGSEARGQSRDPFGLTARAGDPRADEGLGGITPEQWERLQSCLDRFEEAWRQSDAVELGEFLPPEGDPLRPFVLQELIKTELEIHWRFRRHPVLLEEYLRRFPELGGEAAALPAGLVYEEYRVRERYGDRPPLAEYQRRFPQQFPAVERLLAEERSQGTPPPPPPTYVQPAQPPTPRTIVAPPPPFLSTQPGAVLPVGGGYTLVKRIGQGQFGEVWRAEAPGGIDVAIKIIIRTLDHEEAQREREALELIKKLRHTYLLNTHAFFQLDERLLIVMDLADGSLRDLLKEPPPGQRGIPLRDLIQYFREAAEALDYLHDHGVVHRDVKPHNILRLNRHAKIADFGLALTLQARRTMTADCSGTPNYMAPEAWCGKVSKHSDQYSLAVSYAELRFAQFRELKDCQLFPGYTDQYALMHAAISETPDLSPLSEAEQRVLHKALAKKTADRYESCSAFVQALEEAVAPALSRSSASVRFSDIARTDEGEPTLLDDGPAHRTIGRGGRTTLPRKPAWQQETQPEAGRKRLQLLLILFVLLVGLALVIYNLPPSGGGDPTGPSKTAPVAEVDVLPPGCERAEGAKVLTIAHKGRSLRVYDRIALRRTPDGSHTFDPPIVFVLVSKIEEHEIGPPTFYMMEDKVSNRLFRQFAQARPEQIAGIEGMGTHVSLHALEGRDDDLPVFRVRVHEAYHFAEWLGGNLPTKEQWKKGAGFYNPGGRDGPFEKSQLSGIGVGRKYKVPLPVNRPGPRDVSCYGCRDMAGNGYEWIRDLAYWPGPAGPGTPAFLPLPPNKPPPENLNALRLGQTYTADEPLYFDDSPAWEGGQLEWGERYNGPALFDTSFRVVIEF